MKFPRRWNLSRWLPPALVLVVLAAISILAACWFYRQGFLLYYGDALAHLNIARRVVDTRYPTLQQIGTVWLPLPHLLMLPLVKDDWLWRSGLAGTIPAAVAFVLAGLFLFLGVRRLSESNTVAAAATALFALNPNLVYLASIPMTEPLFYACLAALFWLLTVFRQNPSHRIAAAAGVVALAATWTRYEGWFVLPFVALALLALGGKRRWTATLLFCVIAAIGPLVWFFFNWWYWGNWLEFYNGPYSAKAIYQRQLLAGMARYPGDGNWLLAAKYYWIALELTTGRVLVFVGLAGLVAAVPRRWWLLVLLALPPVFYVISMHSAGTPIFVPPLWPFTRYNTRYGLAALPLLGATAACLLTFLPPRFRQVGALVLVAAAVAPWLLHPTPDNWICWVESQRNSRVRRQWTTLAVDYLKPRYRTGSGIFSEFGDLTGIYQEAGIPLAETLYDVDEPEWLAAHARPDLFLHEEWAVATSGDTVATTLLRAWRKGPKYDCVKRIEVGGGPVIEIYRRSGTYPFYESARSQKRLPADVGGAGSGERPAGDRPADLRP